METKQEISVAPMMDWTDRHCRYFLRLISPNSKLYTEMVTTGALIHGDAKRFLRFNNEEHPVALQLGGCDPDDLARCAEMGAREGYHEINLNCGCPSDRVQKGKIGAILMEEPELVAKCIAAMHAVSDVPVTVKCRIGIDEQDSFEFLNKFVATIADKGCKTFIIHARKAWLSGLSPKQNREVPPLYYERVYAIKEKYPELRIILNGGITTVEQIQQVLLPKSSPPEFATCPAKPEGRRRERIVRGSTATKTIDPCLRRDDGANLDGVMIGREAYQNAYFLAEIERKIFGNHDILSRKKVALKMKDYIKKQSQDFEIPVKSVTRHMMSLFHHQPGAKNWRRALSNYPYQEGADETVIDLALKEMRA